MGLLENGRSGTPCLTIVAEGVRHGVPDLPVTHQFCVDGLVGSLNQNHIRSKIEEIIMGRKISSVRAMEILDSRGNPTVRVRVTLDSGMAPRPRCPRGLRPARTKPSNFATATKNDMPARASSRRSPTSTRPSRQTCWAGTRPPGGDRPPDDRPGRHAHQEQAWGQRHPGRLDGRRPGRGESRPTAALRLSGRHRGRAAARADDEHPQRRQACRQQRGFPGVHGHARRRPNFAEALRYGAETFHALKKILHKRNYATSVGDEGGFAPNLKSNEEACEVIIEAIKAAGYMPGKDIAIALDPAASSFYENGAYNLAKSGQGKKTSAQMTDLYKSWVEKYPIVSIEDGLAENDWDGFRAHTAALGERSRSSATTCS